MKYIEDLVKYNANSRDRNTGDCVVRSLSLALDKDYNVTRNELNKMKRDLGFSTYKNINIWKEYIKMHEGIPIRNRSLLNQI